MADYPRTPEGITDQAVNEIVRTSLILSGLIHKMRVPDAGEIRAVAVCAAIEILVLVEALSLGVRQLIDVAHHPPR